MNRIGINIFLALAVGLLLYLVSHGNLMLAALLPAALVACKLVTVRGALIYWAMLAEFSRVLVPLTFIRSIPVSAILQLLFVGGELLNHLAGKEKLRYKTSTRLLFVFLALLAVTAKMRGFGIYMLGGSSIGGMDYIILAIRIAFLAFAAAYADTYGLDLKKLFRFVLYGTLIMLGLNLMLLYGGGLSPLVRRFFQITFLDVSDTGSAARIESLLYIPVAVMPYIMIRESQFQRIALVTGCLLVASLAGFRMAAVLVGIIFVSAELRIHGMTVSRATTYLLSAVLIVGALWMIAPVLNFKIQRALIVLPGFSARVGYEAVRSADSSTEWRINLYKECISHLHEYVFVGRGLGEGLDTVIARFTRVGVTAQDVYEIHSYHLASLELLLDYGFVGGGLMIYAWILRLRESKIRASLNGGASQLEKYALAFLWAMIISMLTYFSNFRVMFLHILMFAYLLVAGVGTSSAESRKLLSGSRESA